MRRRATSRWSVRLVYLVYDARGTSATTWEEREQQSTHVPADDDVQQSQLCEAKPSPLVDLVELKGAILIGTAWRARLVEEGVEADARKLATRTAGIGVGVVIVVVVLDANGAMVVVVVVGLGRVGAAGLVAVYAHVPSLPVKDVALVWCGAHCRLST